MGTRLDEDMPVLRTEAPDEPKVRWLIKAKALNDRGVMIVKEFIVYCDDRTEALDRFEKTGLGEALSIEPATDVPTNLVEGRVAPGA